MRTPKALYPDKRIIYKPELTACPQCGGPLVLCNYLMWDKTVQTLSDVLSVASRPGHCANPMCPGHRMRLLSAEGQQIALPGSTYQKGQPRRALQRSGAWELLPRPSTEADCLAALRQVPPAQLAKEQRRLWRHRERFRLHTRSTRQINAQFEKLRQQWLALAATSSG